MPLEMALSATFLFLSQFVAPWYVLMLSAPLTIYNLYRYIQKDHKLHFLTRKEYKKDFKRVETAFLVKSVFYGLLLTVSLVCFVMTLCDWISARSRKSRK